MASARAAELPNASLAGLSPRDANVVKEIATAPSNPPKTTILIVGASGDGKSTLVNNLKVASENEARVSMNVRGTTKHVKAYQGKNNTIIIDTPGVGDYDVPILMLHMLLDEALSEKGLRIDHVVVTTALNNMKFHLALQIAQLLVTSGFHRNHGHEWDHIIVCGTKRDRAKPEELKTFQQLADLFYEEAPNERGSCVMVDQNNIGELQKVISRKPNKDVAFHAVDEQELASELLAKLGFQGDPRKEREEMAETTQICKRT